MNELHQLRMRYSKFVEIYNPDCHLIKEKNGLPNLKQAFRIWKDLHGIQYYAPVNEYIIDVTFGDEAALVAFKLKYL